MESHLKDWEYDFASVREGKSAWELIQAGQAPPLVILDWVMPGINGVDICRRMRADNRFDTYYIILLTSKGDPEDIVSGLKAGANDYVVKPFDPSVLRARIEVGLRVISLQKRLENNIVELNKALEEVKQLEGMLPICSYCKKIRDDNDYWQQIEEYVTEHSEAHFSHGICPSCYEEHITPQLKAGHTEKQDREV